MTYSTNQHIQLALYTLDDMKGEDILSIDVQNKTWVTNTIIIVTGTSTRHVSALAKHLLIIAKKNKIPIIGYEGKMGSDWFLIDLDDIVVHIMTQSARQFYDLESLWQPYPNIQAACS